MKSRERTSDAPVRIVGILPRGNYRRSANGPSPYRVRSLRRSRAVLRERVVFLRDASVPMNRANPAGRKIKSVTSLSRSAHFCELLAIRGTFVHHWYRARLHETFGEFSLVGWLTFHISNFKSEKIFMLPLSFIVARTKLSFVHYTRQFPWCAVRPAQNFGTSGFFPSSSCVHSFLLHAQYHLAILMIVLFFYFSPYWHK